MSTARRKSPDVLYPSTREQIESVRRRLPIFGPLDLRSLANAAKKAEPGDVEQAFINEYRAQVDEQEAELLRGLGINPSEPNAWRKAFRRLATYDRGLGQISWPARRPTNRNAASWTNECNLNLLREVIILKRSGISEREAIKRLARDKTKRKLFPYKPHFSVDTTRATELKRYESALRKQIEHLKTQSGPDSLLRILVGAQRGDLSPIERILAQYDDPLNLDYLANFEPTKKTRFVFPSLM